MSYSSILQQRIYLKKTRKREIKSSNLGFDRHKYILYGCINHLFYGLKLVLFLIKLFLKEREKIVPIIGH